MRIITDKAMDENAIEKNKRRQEWTTSIPKYP